MKASQKRGARRPEVQGRGRELESIVAAIKGGQNVLLEGPVGVGKTFLAQAAIEKLGRKCVRVDGDSRYTEQKLAGWFDPQEVLKKGYSEKTFIPGPLTEAMSKGAILFINELNRLPEGVQNILLPALDEGVVHNPRVGTLKAKSGFCVIATQNPKEFVATTHLSEAVLDRFVLLRVDYLSAEEELKALTDEFQDLSSEVRRACVSLMRLTRASEHVRRGASLRAAQSVARFMREWGPQKLEREIFLRAVLVAMPTRIEFDRSALDALSSQRVYAEQVDGALSRFVDQVLADPLRLDWGRGDDQKKKTNPN